MYKCGFDHQNSTMLGGEVGGGGGGRLFTSSLVSVPTLLTCIVVGGKNIDFGFKKKFSQFSLQDNCFLCLFRQIVAISNQRLHLPLVKNHASQS